MEAYAKIMAELAHTVHAVAVTEDDGFQDVSETLLDRVRRCVAPEDAALARRCETLIATVSPSHTLIHGDFHTGNVFLQNGEPLLIDMDRVSRGHPIVELSDLYVTYVLLGEDEPAVVENFMGFSYQTATRFFHSFLTHYLGTEDTARLEYPNDSQAAQEKRAIRAGTKEAGPLSGKDFEPDGETGYSGFLSVYSRSPAYKYIFSLN